MVMRVIGKYSRNSVRKMRLMWRPKMRNKIFSVPICSMQYTKAENHSPRSPVPPKIATLPITLLEADIAMQKLDEFTVLRMAWESWIVRAFILRHTPIEKVDHSGGGPS